MCRNLIVERLPAIAGTGLVVVLIISAFALPGRALTGNASQVYLPLVHRIQPAPPPSQTTRLIFIHHSTGEAWLADDHGGLGLALANANYFVSDTNYGWGPQSIGDRTDITDWPEWFRSANTPTYMAALFAESQQHSAYTRLPGNPGGENEIILFKSCFPNSNLEGSPDDPPAPGEGLTVSNAKYIYNDLLHYFSEHTEKLFVVITAPPVQDSTWAENARAFNNWLVNDWLAENDYAYANVAVYDFYNVLTHPDNHHWLVNGEIVHVIQNSQNTLYYPSAADDDHPNAIGDRKATEEFVPVLNAFYQRWKSSQAAEVGPSPSATEAILHAPGETARASPALVDDFESGAPANASDYLVSYWDEATQTRTQCGPQGDMRFNGAAALQIDFDIQAGSWATCVTFFEQPVDWSFADGLALYIHAGQAELGFDVDVFQPGQDGHDTYYHSYYTTPEMVNGWERLEIPWQDFRRAEWESDSGSAVDPSLVAGYGYGFGAPEDAANVGQLWVDDIQLLQKTPAMTATVATTLAASTETSWRLTSTPDTTAPTSSTDQTGGLAPCSSGFAVVALSLFLRRLFKGN